jgi:tripartite-type tricarboxylate transporter receptor subunit TctC
VSLQFKHIAITVGLALSTTLALAEGMYPIKPLRMVVPLPPGGPTDFLARTVAQDLSIALKQPVVVDNRPGADGAIAVREVIAAPPDGHTLLFSIGSMIAIPLMSAPPTFDWLRELAPIGKVGRLTFCLAVNSDVPVRTVAELVSYARANPGKLNYSTSTLSELMSAAQFMNSTGIRMTRVPYKGGAQAMPDLLAGRIQVMFGPMTLALPHAKTGALKVLAMFLPERSPLMPEVPTIGEAGFPGVSVPTWQAIFVTAKTSPVILRRLTSELNATLSKPTLRTAFESRAVFVETSTEAELSQTVKDEQAVWSAVIS